MRTELSRGRVTGPEQLVAPPSWPPTTCARPARSPASWSSRVDDSATELTRSPPRLDPRASARSERWPARRCAGTSRSDGTTAAARRVVARTVVVRRTSSSCSASRGTSVGSDVVDDDLAGDDRPWRRRRGTGTSYITWRRTSSMIARRPRAPVPRSIAWSAIASMASSVNSSSTPSISKSFWYCLTSALRGSVRIWTSASWSSLSTLAMTGSRPMNSGIRPNLVGPRGAPARAGPRRRARPGRGPRR